MWADGDDWRLMLLGFTQTGGTAMKWESVPRIVMVLAFMFSAVRTAPACGQEQNVASPMVEARLFGDDGEPLQGEHQVRMSLYDAVDAVEFLSSKEVAAAFDDGVFVGEAGPVDLRLFRDAMWIGLSVDGAAEQIRFRGPTALLRQETVDVEARAIRIGRTFHVVESVEFGEVERIELVCRRRENRVEIVFSDAVRLELRRGVGLLEFATQVAQQIGVPLKLSDEIAATDAFLAELALARGRVAEELPGPAHAVECQSQD